MKTKKCNLEDILELINENIDKNNLLVDTFWEDHVKDSNHYKIFIDEKLVGCFSIHNKQLLSQLYIRHDFIHLSQEMFSKIKKYEEVKECFVASSDELLLNLCLDNMVNIEKQAYFSIDSKRVIEKEKLRENLEIYLANENDFDMIKKDTGDFFDDIKLRISRNEIYIGKENSEVLGYGIIENNKITMKYASIGMIVKDKHRGKGVARTIIHDLKHKVRNNKRIPISGCWYYNHNSKKTVESAGLVAKSRFYKISF